MGEASTVASGLSGGAGHPEQLGEALRGIWDQQRSYNDRIKLVQPGVESWAQAYLLGVIGEVDEVLREMHWKRNRRYDTPVLLDNVATELVDLTKYVLSLWQEFGFGPEEMLARVREKSDRLDLELTREFFPPSGTRVIVTDLDGTGADFRTGFGKWLGHHDRTQSLAVDLDNGIPFGMYDARKEEFESTGGYNRLPSYPDWVNLIVNEMSSQTFVLVATARPADHIQRIGKDTLDWLHSYGIQPNAMMFGRDERVIELIRLAQLNEVVMLEDEPTLALRAANAGIPVLLRSQPYNQGVAHPLILRCDVFPLRVPWWDLKQIRMEVRNGDVV